MGVTLDVRGDPLGVIEDPFEIGLPTWTDVGLLCSTAPLVAFVVLEPTTGDVFTGTTLVFAIGATGVKLLRVEGLI